MSAQVVSMNTARKTPVYPFLSQPPPQKRRPTQPLPSPPTSVCAPVIGRRRSATTSAITAWVAEVIPGSPAPYSPRRSPSSFCSSRRPSLSRSIGRRPSITSVRVSSASFLHFSDSPTTASRIAITPSVKDFTTADLALVGYTSVFVQIPQTPMSAGAPARRRLSPQHILPIPVSPVKGATKSLKHFRSLTSLKPARRTRSRSNAAPPTPPLPSLAKAAMDAKKAHAASSAAVAKNKKSKYAKFRPPPLANELALAQLMDGGKLGDHVTRFAEAHAKAAGAVKVDGQLVGVGDVWRDGEGGIWRDQDEEWEYAHLLGGDEDFCMGEVQWVEFSSEADKDGVLDERRESTSTQDSDLSTRFAMKTEGNSQDDLAAFGGDLVSTVRIKPGMSVLAIPSRSRRTAKHLRKPEFLLNAFPVPLTPPGLPRTPSSPRFASGAGRAVIRPKGKGRRRPAPLKLMPPSPAFKCPTNPEDTEVVRKDFLEDSFAPEPQVIAAPYPEQHGRAGVPIAVKAATQKSTALQLKGFFRAMGGKRQTVVTKS
ncbi:unnamed protein product [Somion occarium]|uniref:Uncharacterized protein n=1 Tax=Somion occarium TaxID=3059160 RepID=A0ABP1E0Z3_9APHY